MREQTDILRLQSKIAINGLTGCWEWTASLTENGYGQFRFRGTRELAHRVSWILFRGEIPRDGSRYGTMNVLHRCDNPRCVNPGHLFLGDQHVNAKDSVSKGRWGKRGVIGVNHGRARLTETEIREIRASPDASEALAKRLRVSVSAIQHIRKRRTWRHVN